MTGFPTYIDVSQARLVGAGNKRFVYEHPAFPGMLVKVVKPELVDEHGQLIDLPTQKKKFYAWPNRLGAFLALDRELKEFLAFSVRPSNKGTDWPIQRFWGFVDTDLGLGLVVEKLTRPNGELAPTLLDMALAGEITPAHRTALAHLFDELARLHLCIGNLHLKNIVFVGEVGKGGRFIGIDGLGEKNLIPAAEWSAAFNRYQIRRRAKKLFASLDRMIEKGKAKRT